MTLETEVQAETEVLIHPRHWDRIVNLPCVTMATVRGEDGKAAVGSAVQINANAITWKFSSKVHECPFCGSKEETT